MINFEKSETRKNLARAFAGECQAGARYQFLGMKAASENLSYLQTILKTLAKNEMSHAKVYYDHIIELGGKEQNNIDITAGYPFPPYEIENGFKHASIIEMSEHKNIYPSFARVAKDEGFMNVYESFKMIAEVEEYHSHILAEIHNKIKTKKLYKSPEPTRWKCTECAYESIGKTPWNICPICKYDQGYTEVKLTQE